MSGTEQVSFKSADTGPDAPAKTPEQIAADQAALARAGSTDPAPSGERPQWLPPQYKTVADFVKAHDDTKAALTRTQQELSTLKNPNQQQQQQQQQGDNKDQQQQQQQDQQKPGDKADKAASDAVAKAGLDVSPWQQEFNQTRDVSEKGRAEIAKALESQFGENARQLVDDFIEGKKLAVANYEAEVQKTVGGPEKFAEMTAWAKDNFTDAEKIEFNKAVNSSNLLTAQMAVNNLKAKYEAANGVEPSLLTGDGPGSNAAQGFATTFEMQQAMADPRYAKDPIYRRAVELKAMRSNF